MDPAANPYPDKYVDPDVYLHADIDLFGHVDRHTDMDADV